MSEKIVPPPVLPTPSLGLFRTLQEDMRVMKIERRGFWSMVRCFFMRSDFPAVCLFRFSSRATNKGFIGRAAGWFFWRLNLFVSGCDLSPRALIGPGFSLPHPFGIVIGSTIIGSNVEIMQNVTVGRHVKDDPALGYTSRAIIGNNVTIYAGAVLVGNFNVGDGAEIGANAVVLKDVPAYHRAVGVPARNLPPRTLVEPPAARAPFETQEAGSGHLSSAPHSAPARSVAA